MEPTFPFAMMIPFTIPITRPANNPTAIARNGSMPLAIIPATSALDNAKIEPTDKSIPLLKLQRSFRMQ